MTDTDWLVVAIVAGPLLAEGFMALIRWFNRWYS